MILKLLNQTKKSELIQQVREGVSNVKTKFSLKQFEKSEKV